MEWERGATILVACHVGAVGRWLAVGAALLPGGKEGKAREEERKGMGARR